MSKMQIKYLLSATGVILSLLMTGCGFSANDDNKETEVNESSFGEFAGNAEFEFTEHNFGVITSGEEVGARFGFKNTGDEPLLIERVDTGCGCTVAEFSEKPLKSGESGFVEIVFDSRGRRGSQFQEARVFFHGHNKPTRLSVFAEVDKN